MTISNTIVCDEETTPDPIVWRGTINELGADWECVQRHASRNRIRVDAQGLNIEISGRDRVGCIVLPSGRRIIIRSKIDGLTLIEWLIYLGRFPELIDWSDSGFVSQKGPFEKLIVSLFLRELSYLTDFHLRKDYVWAHTKSSQIRGKIHWAEATSKPWEHPRLPQLVRERRYDTRENQVLAAALKLVAKINLDLDESEARTLAKLCYIWTQLPISRIDQWSLVQSNQLIGTSGYRKALQLAKLLLLGATFRDEPSSGGDSFMISLSKIWEDSIEKMCLEIESLQDWKSVNGEGKTRHWDDLGGKTDANRWMRADTLLVNSQGERWVLDAKYKRGFGNESRQDRFQMCAYLIAFRASRATLIYPDGVGHSSSLRVLLRDILGGMTVVIDSIALSMANGPGYCKNQLQSLLALQSNGDLNPTPKAFEMI
jgi:5-methylcytosine-specific restriction endonuclease McrBC regulatory subunit McrC